MDDSLITSIIVAVGAVIAVAVIAVRSGQTVTVGTALAALSDIEKVAGAARQWVLAAEQLWLTGQLDKDKRFEFVLGKLQAVYPEIDEDTLEGAIEGAVLWAKLLSGTAARAELEEAGNG